MDEPRHGGLIDKSFIYTVIIIGLIITGAFLIINRLDVFGDKFRGGSWYVYCDLKSQSCSCNVYGLLDDPQESQMKICLDFMQDYTRVANNNTKLLPVKGIVVYGNTT